jgi:hypothetical protein
MDGRFSLAITKSSFTYLSDSPAYFDINSLADIEKKVDPLAQALAN